MARILITDGEQRSALAAVRSLGRAGHVVFVASQRRRSLAGSSRYARDTAVVAEPLHSPDAFVRDVAALVGRWKIDLLLPVTEAALLALLPERDRIATVLPFPDMASFQRLCDKSEVANVARSLGISVPSTIVVRSRAAFAELDVSQLRFPLVIKPHRSVTQGPTRHKAGVLRAPDLQALKSGLDTIPDDAFPALLQERIVGPGIGIFVLLIGGEPRAAFAHRRIREKPPWGGVSVYRESIPLDSELLARSVELLRCFEFTGAAMVEYKVDASTQIPYIMEINGRLWGSLQLAIDAGVDFPALLVEAALNTGERVSSPNYKCTRSRWFWGDVDSLLLRLRGASDENSETPSRLTACIDFLRAFGPRTRNEVFRWRDPLPALRETLDWVQSPLVRRAGLMRPRGTP
jgi:predicted ATP-grasp superfamily ATP-dependent carboligase